MRTSVPLSDVVDPHVHSSPDVVPRCQDDLELASAAADAGMAMVVLKNHHACTAARAAIVGRVVTGVSVLGGLVLNQGSCGGLNPYAVQASLAMGARVVWMPTVSARNHQAYLRTGDASAHVRSLGIRDEEGITIMSSGGGLVPAVGQILDLVAAAGSVLATGHLAVAETCALVDDARRRGVERIVVTHPEVPQIAMPLDVQRDLAGYGAIFERCYYSVLEGLATAELLRVIRAVGVASTVLATDLGQTHNPPPVEGYRAFREALMNEGLTEDEWRQVACTTAAELFDVN